MARVLITGCSSGIGRATAVLLARKGYEVVATARSPESLADLDVASRLQLDVDDDRSVAAAIGAAGDIDVLVNNAAWEVAGPVEKVPVERVRAMFETNVLGVMRTVQAVAPAMRERGSGTIINLSSTAGRFSAPLVGAYAATKFAVEALSEALHYELGHFGIRVMLVEPGSTDTAWDANTEWHGVEDGPYDELMAMFPRQATDLPTAEGVAEVILQAIEAEDFRLRWPTTERVAEYLDAQRRMTDAEWEQAFRRVRHLDW